MGKRGGEGKKSTSDILLIILYIRLLTISNHEGSQEYRPTT